MDRNRPNRLDSWKEIADYIGRDVRTAIRWGKAKGLPVHRVPGGTRPGVYALASELNAWLATGRAATVTDQIPVQTGVVEKRQRSRGTLIATCSFAVLLMATFIWLYGRGASARTSDPLHRPLTFSRADYAAAVPLGIAAGDFNGDQHPDLIFTNSSDDSLTLLPGDGYGGFRTGRRIPAGKEPERLAIGDFNADGHLDVAITHRISGEVRVLLGNGEGDFKDVFRWPGAGRSRWISTADLNGDGRLDLAVARSADRRLTILLGQGDGRFRLAAEYETSEEPSALAISDYNNDGISDIAVADYRIGTGKTVSLYLGRGDGTFGPRQELQVGVGPLAICTGDLNGDGTPDIVTANYGGSVSLLLSRGAGQFTSVTDLEAKRASGYVVISDFDRDGYPDLAVLGEHSDSISFMPGKGDGSFGPAQDIATGSYPDAAVVGDFDRDGRMDIAVANTFGNSVSVFLNRSERGMRRSLSAWLHD
jgi:hypothetical protein